MATTKDRRAGMYWLNEKPHISVTEVLKVIAKPSIQYWYGQQVYYAVMKDPTIDERAALAAPYAVSKSAANRGSTVHSLIEAYKTTSAVVNTIPEYDGYARAFYKWVEDFKPTIIENERTVVNPTKGYAGTLDMIAEIGGKRHVIDFKTNKDGNIYDEAHMQVSAYLNCDGMTDCDGGIIVALAADGTYTHQIAKNGYIAFLSALDLYVFLNYAKIKALGWSR